MRSVRPFFLDIGTPGKSLSGTTATAWRKLEVVDRLLQLGLEVLADLDQALELRLLLVEDVRAFGLGELAFDGDVGEVDDGLLADDDLVGLLDDLVLGERRGRDDRRETGCNEKTLHGACSLS